jgi:spermidine synthase
MNSSGFRRIKIRVVIPILVMGFSGLVAEILLLRELLIVFSGNELSIGIILSNWLILEALGSFLAGRTAEKSKDMAATFTLITILFALSLFPTIYLTRLLKPLLGVSIGESLGLLPMFYASLLIMLPVSLLHGALFACGCRIYALVSGQESSAAGRVYVYETVGTLIGGIFCTYLFLVHLNAFEAAAGLALTNLFACLILPAPAPETRSSPKSLPGVLAALILVFSYLLHSGQIGKLHQNSVNAQWKNQNVVHYQNSRYGNICVIQNQEQFLFFQDGMAQVITPVPDIDFVAEFVHLPLLAHSHPENLLVISSGAGGVISEALKYASLKSIEYAELDPLLLDLLRKFPTPLTESELTDSRVRVKPLDGRRMLQSTQNTYDLILVGIHQPASLQTNRFFTHEFYALARQKLNQGGILVLGLPGSLSLHSEALQDLNGCIYHTLKSVFPHIRTFPGDGRNLFLAADARDDVTVDRHQMLQRLKQRNIETSLLVHRQIDRKTHHGWEAWFSGFIEGASQRINSDFHPRGLFYSIAQWNEVFAPSFASAFRQLERLNLKMITLLWAVFVLLYLFLRSKNIQFKKTAIPFSILTTGLAGMIFELMIIFTFQSLYGYVFSWIGLLVAAFMAGAAGGAGLASLTPARATKELRLYRKTELSIIGFAVACPLVFFAAPALPGGLAADFVLKVIFILVSIICGLFIGAQFPLANRIYLQNGPGVTRTAGLLYAADLLGGWLGGITGAVILLPVLGVFGACLTVALLKLASFIVIATPRDPSLSGSPS